MDPHFSFLVFMARAAWAIKGKNSVHNLPYEPRTRLKGGYYWDFVGIGPL